MYSRAPRENRSIRFVPVDILAYQWNNTFSLKDYWEHIKQQTAGANQGQQGISSQQAVAVAEGFLGLSLERDILPALGDEIGGYLADVELGEPFPIPELVLFMKIEKIR